MSVRVLKTDDSGRILLVSFTGDSNVNNYPPEFVDFTHDIHDFILRDGNIIYDPVEKKEYDDYTLNDLMEIVAENTYKISMIELGVE